MSKLYLFVTSERPDPYLNSILHCVQHENIDEVIFVGIEPLSDNGGSRKKYKARITSASTIRNEVNFFLNILAKEGVYRYSVKDENHKSGDKLPLKDIYPEETVKKIMALYKGFADKKLQWSDESVPYRKLKEYITNVHKKEAKSIFDITSINKRYLGDIYAISTIEKIENIFTFDLKPDFDHPWNMLFHALNPENDEESKYEYLNVVDTPIFKECADSVNKQRHLLKVTTIATFVFIAIYVLINSFLDGNNGFNQTFGILSGIASLASLILTIYPLPQRK